MEVLFRPCKINSMFWVSPSQHKLFEKNVSVLSATCAKEIKALTAFVGFNHDLGPLASEARGPVPDL